MRFAVSTFLALLSLSLVPQYSATAGTLPPTDPCLRALSPAVNAALDANLRERTRPLVEEGRPEVIGPDGAPIDLLTTIETQYWDIASEGYSRVVHDFSRELFRLWTGASQENLRRIAEQRVAEHRAKLAELRRQNPSVVQTPGGIEYDERGVARTPFLMRHPEAALEVLKAKPNLKVMDQEIETARWLIQRAQESVAKEVHRAVSVALAEELGRKPNPDWGRPTAVAREGLERVITELRRIFPLDDAQGKNTDQLRAHLAAGLGQGPRAVRDDSGRIRLDLPSRRIRVEYDPGLATSVLSAAEGFPNSKGFALALLHGAGAVSSNGASWKHRMAPLMAGGANPFAIDLPLAGTGPQFRGFDLTNAYLNRWIAGLRSKADAAGSADMPLVVMGRSLGGQQTLAHALIFDGSTNAVDAYVSMSVSNPYTMSQQFERVYEQVRQGTLGGIVSSALDNAADYARGFRGALEATESARRQRKWAGTGLLFLQGEADRDGGATVLEDLQRLKDRFAPGALVYVFDDPLKKYPFLKLDQFQDDALEAQHNLLSTVANMSPEAAVARFPGIDPVDRPMMSDQSWEVIGSIYALGDALAANRIPLPEMERRARVWRQYREMLSGRADGSLLAWYRDKSGITPDQVAQATRRDTRAWRMRRLEQFLARAHAHYAAIANDLGP